MSNEQSPALRMRCRTVAEGLALASRGGADGGFR